MLRPGVGRGEGLRRVLAVSRSGLRLGARGGRWRCGIQGPVAPRRWVSHVMGHRDC